jgi:hypothetical protein
MTTASAAMPTNKQRLTLNIPPELYEALETCANRANRTLANQATIALEEFLLKTGDLTAPVKLALQGRPRKTAAEKSGAGAGRKPKGTKPDDDGPIDNTPD